MNYIINGITVTAERFDRDAEDNFNAGISYEMTENDDTITMTYGA